MAHWPREFNGVIYISYEDYILRAPEWVITNERYNRSNLSKYCWICDSPDFLLHHENYDRLANEDLRKDLVPLCYSCHTAVHFDDSGRKIPLRDSGLQLELIERRKQLRRSFLLAHTKPTTLLPVAARLLYRVFW